jgi:hypothetical protein
MGKIEKKSFRGHPWPCWHWGILFGGSPQLKEQTVSAPPDCLMWN